MARTRVTGRIGLTNVGMANLRRNRRGAGGRFTSTPGAQPVYIEAHKWASVIRYTRTSAEGPLKGLIADINRWVRHVGEDAHKVAYNALLPTFEKSKRYCPVSPNGSPPYGRAGTLRDSGKLEVREVAGRKGGDSTTEVRIGYGGNGVPFYAVFVHEIPYRHDAPTRHKFLESAIKEDYGEIQRRLMDGAKKLSGR